MAFSYLSQETATTDHIALEDGSGALLLDTGPNQKDTPHLGPRKQPKGIRFISPKARNVNQALVAPLGQLTLSGIAPLVYQQIKQPAKSGRPVDKGPPGLRYVGPKAYVVPAVTNNQSITAPLGTLTLTGLIPTLTQGNSLTVPLGSISLAGLVPGLTQGNSLTSPIGTLTLNGLVPSLTQGNSVASPLGSITLNGLAPTFQQTAITPSNAWRPPVGPKGLRYVSPKAYVTTVAAPQSITAPLGQLTLSGFTHSFTQGNSIAAPLGTLTLQDLVPAFTQGNSITAPLGTITLSGLVPALTQGSSLIGPLGTLTLTGFAPTFVQVNNVSPRVNRGPSGLRYVSRKAYVLPASPNQTITAPLGIMSLGGLVPTFAQSVQTVNQAPTNNFGPPGLKFVSPKAFVPANNNVLFQAPLGTLTLSGLVPTFAQPITLTAVIGQITLQGLVPTFAQGTVLDASGAQGTLTLNGLVPTITQGNSVTAPLGTFTLTGLVPSFTQGNSLTAPLGTLTLNGLAPTFDQTGPQQIIVPLGTLTLQGLNPNFSQSSSAFSVFSEGGGGGKRFHLHELELWRKIDRKLEQGMTVDEILADLNKPEAAPATLTPKQKARQEIRPRLPTVEPELVRLAAGLKDMGVALAEVRSRQEAEERMLEARRRADEDDDDAAMLLLF